MVCTRRENVSEANSFGRASWVATLIFAPLLGLDSENVLTSRKICASPEISPDVRATLKSTVLQIVYGFKRFRDVDADTRRWCRSDDHLFPEWIFKDRLKGSGRIFDATLFRSVSRRGTTLGSSFPQHRLSRRGCRNLCDTDTLAR